MNDAQTGILSDHFPSHEAFPLGRFAIPRRGVMVILFVLTSVVRMCHINVARRTLESNESYLLVP